MNSQTNLKKYPDRDWHERARTNLEPECRAWEAASSSRRQLGPVPDGPSVTGGPAAAVPHARTRLRRFTGTVAGPSNQSGWPHKAMARPEGRDTSCPMRAGFGRAAKRNATGRAPRESQGRTRVSGLMVPRRGGLLVGAEPRSRAPFLPFCLSISLSFSLAPSLPRSLTFMVRSSSCITRRPSPPLLSSLLPFYLSLALPCLPSLPPLSPSLPLQI